MMCYYLNVQFQGQMVNEDPVCLYNNYFAGGNGPKVGLFLIHSATYRLPRKRQTDSQPFSSSLISVR